MFKKIAFFSVGFISGFQTSLVSAATNFESLKKVTSSVSAPLTSNLNKGSSGKAESLGDMFYSSTLKMRQELKVGAGISVGGALGLGGINGEFNFEDENGVVAGFGAGSGYNSISLAWKHTYEGDYLSRYFTAGYSRWYNSRGQSQNWKNSGILDQVLTKQEKQTGQFGADFLNLSFGIQYNQLSGDFYGFSCYAEIIGMFEAESSKLVPSGVVGTTYYF